MGSAAEAVEMPSPGWSTASATVPYTARLSTTTRVVTFHVVWTRVLPRRASLLTSSVEGASLLTTMVKNRAASTAEKTGHAISASNRMVKLSLEARSDACPGGM